MMMRAIDRSRQTQSGMALSFGMHTALLLLLVIMMGRQVAQMDLGSEITEIAYIEARYGEDVAAKVKLKAPPTRPGMGVSTDSAQKPKPAEPEVPEAAPRPEPRPAVVEKPIVPEQTAPPQRVEVAEVSAPELPVVEVQPKALAEAPQLAARTAPPPNRKIIDASKLSGNLNVETVDAKALASAPSKPRGSFKPKAGGALETKQGRLAIGDVAVAAAPGSSSRQGRISEAPSAASSGGNLQGRTRSGNYQSPTASLKAGDRSQSGTPGGQGIVDVEGPRGGGSEKGRKTILDYGSGSGGRGGGLAGRQTRLVEPPSAALVAEAASGSADDAKKDVAEAEVSLSGKGVGMTISGQIKGRKILRSVAPEYSREARRQGWEGVVAVHFTVLADGRVKDNVYFDQTSVHRDLNQAAMAAIKQFRFAPLPAEQSAVEQWGVITIVFRLN